MRVRPGTLGWLGLTAYVAIVDIILIRSGHDTLSQVFKDSLSSKAGRAVIVAWGIVTLHLFGVLFPPRARSLATALDPLGKAADLISR